MNKGIYGRKEERKLKGRMRKGIKKDMGGWREEKNYKWNKVIKEDTKRNIELKRRTG